MSMNWSFKSLQNSIEGRALQVAGMNTLRAFQDISSCSVQNRGRGRLFLLHYIWWYFKILCFTSLLQTYKYTDFVNQQW